MAQNNDGMSLREKMQLTGVRSEERIMVFFSEEEKVSLLVIT
jgi:hypothetical protein